MKRIRQNAQTNSSPAEVRTRGNSHSRFGLLRILCLLCFLCYGLAVEAATTINVSGIYYSIGDGNTAKVTSNDNKYSGRVEIPSTFYYNGKTYYVTSIGNDAFKGCSDLTSITIPSNVSFTSIGTSAFSGCSSLTSITIPNFVTSIGGSAFYNCSGLTSITIPSSVTSIGNNAFDGCSSLTAINVSAGSNDYKSVDGILFNKSGSEIKRYPIGKSGTSYTIPSSVTSIGAWAFTGCSGLTEVIIPSNVTSISARAFTGCSGLTEVTIPSSVTSIGVGAFQGCSSLTKITLPFVGDKPHSATDTYQYPFGYIFGSTEYIGETSALQYYYGSSTISTTNARYFIPTSLKEVVITGSSHIQYGAFYNCSELTSVTLPESVTSIGGKAFYNCSGMAEVIFENATPPEFSANVFDNSNNCPIYVPTVEAVTKYKNASNMSSYANRVKCGAEIDGIKYEFTSSGAKVAANNYSGDIVIPENISFNGNNYSVISISEYAFNGCSGLTSVTIPASVTSIVGYDAFQGCSSLTAINVATDNNYYKSVDGILFNKSGSVIIRYPMGKSETSYTIPSGVTSINNRTFNGCNNLTSITIPSGVTSIDSYAFQGCSGLTSVTIPSGVTSINNRTFNGCSSLTSVTIPSSVTSIGSYAFNGCSSLTSITIPSSVTSIGESAFSGCSGLTKITLPFVGNNPHEPTDTWQYPFGFIFGTDSYTGTATTQYYYGSSTTSTTNSKYCIPTSLKEVVITGSSHIPYGAFYGCGNLTSVTIPSSVTSMGGSAFYNCRSLTEVTFESTTPPSFGSYVFDNTNDCPIYVPTSDAVTEYKAANNMSSYASRVVANPVCTITVVANNADYGTVSGGGKFDTRTTTSTEISATANDHYRFAGWYDGSTDNPRTITIPGATTYTAIFKRALTVSNIVAANKVYDGTADATLTFATDKLADDDVTVDYTATFDNANAGTGKTVTYSFTLSGADADNYVLASTEGTVSADITAISVSAPTIALSATEFTYNGSAQTPTVTVKDGSTVIPTSEYSVTYSADVTNAGQKTVTITDNEGGNYVVSGSATFVINPKEVLNPIIVLNETELTYNGSAQTPSVSSVKDGSTVIPASEYSVAYSADVTNVGQKTVTISNVSGNYTVNGSATFTISPKVVSSPTIALSATSFTYNGSAQTPTITVKDGSTVIPTSEYSVTYSADVTNAGQKTVTISNVSGNYTVNGSAAFVINPKAVSSPTIELSATEFTYNGSAQTPTVTVKDGSTVIPASEYSVAYSADVTNAGEKTITISNVSGNYTVNGSATFTISPKVISSPTIELSATSFTYNGSAQTPTITVKDGSTVIPASEYSVAYSADVTNAGEKTVTISNVSGNYNVNGSANFTINPKEVSLTWSNTSLTYNGSAQAPTATATGLVEGDECLVTVSGAQTNAGSDYTATATALSNANYTLPTAATTAFSIAAKEVGLEWSNTAFTYNGSAQAPTATATGLVEGDECSLTVSGAQTNAGSNYTATASALSNANYTLPATTTTAFSIAQATPGYTMPDNQTIACNQTLADITLPAGFAFADVNTILAIGENTIGIIFTPEDAVNYNVVDDIEITVTVSHTAVTDAAVAATCTATGLTEGSHCSVCEQELVAQEVIPMIEHTAVTDAAVAATCTATGLTEGSHCSVCEHVIVAQEVVPMIEHTAVTDAAVAATCTATGLTEGSHCEVCHAVLVAQQTVPMIEHTAAEAVKEDEVAATCTEAGSHNLVVYCSVCHAELSREAVTIAATGHTAGAAVVENYTAPTITTEGSGDSVVYCTVCRAELSRTPFTLPVSDHEHIAGAPVVENYVAPTCEVAGSVDSMVYCTVNGELLNRTSHTIPATGHTAGKAVAENLKAATCTVAGSVDSVVYCTVCNAELSRKTVEIPATGHTIVVDAAVAATTTETGLTEGSHCSVCHEVIVAQQVIPVIESQGGNENQGNENQGEENQGNENQGEENQGNESQGEENQGNENQGEENQGNESQGEENQGEENQGNENQGNENQGEENQGGNEGQGEENQGNENQGGNEGQGEENQGGNENTNPGTAVAETVANAVNIYAYGNTIVVESADALEGEISIFDVNGRMVAKELAAGSRTEIMMQNQGIYIVKVNNTAKRVMVY